MPFPNPPVYITAVLKLLSVVRIYPMLPGLPSGFHWETVCDHGAWKGRHSRYVSLCDFMHMLKCLLGHLQNNCPLKTVAPSHSFNIWSASRLFPPIYGASSMCQPCFQQKLFQGLCSITSDFCKCFSGILIRMRAYLTVVNNPKTQRS